VQRIADAARARRLARAIVSDLLLYDAVEVRAGIRNDDLFERMGERFAEARGFLAERVDPDLLGKEDFLGRAIVDVLICGCRGVPSRIW
jgi:hypothetical protein